MKPFQRAMVDDLEQAVRHDRPLLQVVIGPRQVGKTTAVRHRGSSPKLILWNSALIHALSPWSFAEARREGAWWGRVVENDPFPAAMILFHPDEVLDEVMVGEPARLVRRYPGAVVTADLPASELMLRPARDRIVIGHFGEERFQSHVRFSNCGWA